MIKVFISSRIQYLYTQYSSESWSFKRGYCNCIVKDIKSSHFFMVSFFVDSIGGTSLHACCVVCFFLFCVDRILPTFIVRSLPPPPPLTLSLLRLTGLQSCWLSHLQHEGGSSNANDTGSGASKGKVGRHCSRVRVCSRDAVSAGIGRGGNSVASSLCDFDAIRGAHGCDLASSTVRDGEGGGSRSSGRGCASGPTCPRRS